MTSLDETLPALSASLPEIRGRTQELIQQGEALKTAANGLLQEIAEKRSQAEELLAELRSALAELQAEAEGAQAELESAMGALESGLDRALPALKESLGRVTEAVDGAETAMTGFAGELGEAATAANRMEESCEEGERGLSDAARAGQGTLETAGDAVAAEAAALRQAVEDAKSGLSQELAELREQMTRFLEAGRAEMEDTAQKLRATLSTHQDTIAHEAAHLDEGQQALTEQVRARLESEVKARVLSALEPLLEGFGEVSRNAARQTAACQRAHQELEARLGALTEAMEPMPSAVGQVQRAADELGLTWG